MVGGYMTHMLVCVRIEDGWTKNEQQLFLMLSLYACWPYMYTCIWMRVEYKSCVYMMERVGWCWCMMIWSWMMRIIVHEQPTGNKNSVGAAGKNHIKILSIFLSLFWNYYGDNGKASIVFPVKITRLNVLFFNFGWWHPNFLCQSYQIKYFTVYGKVKKYFFEGVTSYDMKTTIPRLRRNQKKHEKIKNFKTCQKLNQHRGRCLGIWKTYFDIFFHVLSTGGVCWNTCIREEISREMKKKWRNSNRVKSWRKLIHHRRRCLGAWK